MSEIEAITKVLKAILGSENLDDTITMPASADPANDVSIYGALRKVFDENTTLYNDWFEGGRLDLILDDIEDKTHEVADVIIYPVAEDMATTEITDDGTSPALTGAVSDTHITEGAAEADPAWLEYIDFEQQGTAITVISIYYELHWEQQLTVGIGAATESLAKWQISDDGGTSWVDVTDNVSENNAAYQEQTRAGVGVHITTIDAGANQLGLRLCTWVDADGNSSVETKVRSDSYIRITYRKS